MTVHPTFDALSAFADAPSADVSQARVRRLVITHISDELDERRAREEAEQAFGGPVLVAREGAVYTV